jgi:hypothetical protein
MKANAAAGIGHFRAGRKLHLDQMHRQVRQRRHLAPQVAAGRVAPGWLVVAPHQPRARLVVGGQQRAQGHAERAADAPEQRRSRAGLAALELAQHRLRHAGAARQLIQRPAAARPLVAQAARDQRRGVVLVTIHYR